MNSQPARRATMVALAAATLLIAPATSATARDLVADSTPSGPVIATTAASAPGEPAGAGPRAVASLPRGIVVTEHGGRPVALFAAGQAPLRKPRPGGQPATFTGLRAGTTYTVIVGGRSLGRVMAIDRPGAVSRVVVHAGAAPGSVDVTWSYHGRIQTGGANVWFDVQATSPSATTVSRRVARTDLATLTGLDPTALYTFSVTVANTAGRARAMSASMSKTLAQLSGSVQPTGPAPAPAPSPSPSPTPSPAPPAAPSTRTIYVCPTDYVENTAGTCTRTLAYTYHQEASGPAPLLASYQTDVRACPTGYSLEDYGWVMYCRLYGPIPMVSVKDQAPAGFTDNGSAWVRTVPKDPVVVPA